MESDDDSKYLKALQTNAQNPQYPVFHSGGVVNDI